MTRAGPLSGEGCDYMPRVATRILVGALAYSSHNLFAPESTLARCTALPNPPRCRKTLEALLLLRLLFQRETDHASCQGQKCYRCGAPLRSPRGDAEHRRQGGELVRWAFR